MKSRLALLLPFVLLSVLVLLSVGAWFVVPESESNWSGVDETVVEKFAEEAGRPPRGPFINTDQGDLLLFVFLLAGTVGGFVGGYYFRELFPSQRDTEKRDRNA